MAQIKKRNEKYMIPWAPLKGRFKGLGRWLRFDDNWLLMMSALGGKAALLADYFREETLRYKENRLSYFLAHCQQVDFINDWADGISLLRSGVQRGKTWALLAKLGLCACPTDPTWPCFEYGLKPPRWEAKMIAVGTYQMALYSRNIWKKFAEIMPADELREYSPHWKIRDASRKYKRKTPPWGSGWAAVPFASGSIVNFHAYAQNETSWTGATYEDVFCDEQPPEEVYRNCFDRTITAENSRMHISCTPHRVAGQPETGAGTWIHRKVLGALDDGVELRQYQINTDNVPNCIISASRKKREYFKYIVAPRKSGNMVDIRHGKAKYYGDFESREGLVYEEWNPSVQWIDPFTIPKHWTLYRGIDPGKRHHMACLWAAASPWHDVVLFREYREANLSMRDNVINIIEASGNKRVQSGDPSMDLDGNTTVYFREEFCGEKYVYSSMDSRNFSHPTKDITKTEGEVYSDAGLDCIQASGMHDRNIIPILRNEYFAPVPEREHLLVRMKIMDQVINPDTDAPIHASPRLYIFNTLTRLRGEIEGYVYKEESRDPENKGNDLLTAMKYVLRTKDGDEPRYCGPSLRSPSESLLPRGVRELTDTPKGQLQPSKYTGYRRAGAR